MSCRTCASVGGGCSRSTVAGAGGGAARRGRACRPVELFLRPRQAGGGGGELAVGDANNQWRKGQLAGIATSKSIHVAEPTDSGEEPNSYTRMRCECDGDEKKTAMEQPGVGFCRR